MKRQQAPYGTPFKLRKTQPLRDKKGCVKHEMFAKLRTDKYLKAKGSNNDAVVVFIRRVQMIACVHQFSLDEVAINLQPIKYDKKTVGRHNAWLQKDYLR
ncbi:phage virion morphogenesis protein [Serratia proteamaculans]